MAAIINKYYKKGVTSEQTLFDKLKTESIQMLGRSFYYLPRKVQIIDEILGEDVLSSFALAIPIEAYMENSMGFDGDREIFSKFGLEVHNQFKLIMSVKRWETEVGKVVANDPEILVQSRPQEGDLIYDPLTKFLMEIKFTDHDAEFYQLGKNYLYHLTCEAFQYSSEKIETGIDDIDRIDLGNSFDLLDNQLKMEDGLLLLADDCESIIMDTEEVTNDIVMKYNKGEEFAIEADNLNWSVNNPFSGL